MIDEKFINDENIATLWDKIKEYINANTAKINGGLTIEVDEEVFGEPPYTLIFTEETEESEE